MCSKKQSDQKRRQAELARRRQNRLRNPEGWQPPPPAEAEVLDIAPIASPDEPAEDRALFDPTARDALCANLQAELALVQEAFDLCARGEPHAALDRLTAIARKSPYADWRLFIRGLVPFQRGDRAAAREAWHRLEAGRRPARIAITLDRVWDAATVGAAAPADGTSGVEAAAVNLMRRASLLAASREIAAVRHRDEERTFSASQAALAIRLEKHYRPLDFDFVSEFSAACRALAFGQADDEPFLALCRSTAGPADDPRNTRLQFIHLQRFIDADEQVRQGAREYVDRDLPGLTHLPEPLRTALASVTLERAASSLLDREDGFLQDLTPQEERVCQRLLCESLERHPRNLRAHESLIDLLATRAEEDDSRGDADRALIDAKLAFVGQFPDQYEHVRDLIDRFIAAGEFARAEPLVKSLTEQRTGDMGSRATPWRFELLRASSRAAADDSLPEARGALEACITAWPNWMPRWWIPFLEAALLLREGNEAGVTAALDVGRRESPDDLTSDMMLHEALVRLKCPAPRIEPIRTRVQNAAKHNAIDSPIAPLAHVACFFMELERCGIPLDGEDHPAFAIGRAFSRRLWQDGTSTLGSVSGGVSGLPVNDPGFWAAFRWLATHDFFGTVSPKREPKGFARLADNQPRAAAEVLEWLTRTAPSSLTTRKAGKRLTLVEKFIATEQNPATAQRLRGIVMAARKAIEADQERERRARFRSAGRGLAPPGRALGSSNLPPLLQVILERGGPEAVAEIVPLLLGPMNEKNAKRIAGLAARLGISEEEMIDLSER
ncbi:MAG: hypothetical protein DWH87_04120 [Planctomycetota bacterium]|nr:MAG: hypothetical protein DWH87_04120 [Planctomycetota bacterium]